MLFLEEFFGAHLQYIEEKCILEEDSAFLGLCSEEPALLNVSL